MARKSPRPSPLDDEMRRLYRLPLGEFTAERNALAKRLQKEGDGDAANEVKALPKASVSAWAVNQLFAQEEERMQELLDAGERARSALQHTLTVGDAEVLRDALQDERELRDDLRHRAAAILTEGLRAPGQAILDRVTINLDALALSPGAAEEAERGWLSTDLEPPGFEVLSGLQFTARRPDPDRRGLRLVPSPAEKRPAEKKPAEAKPVEKKPAAKPAPAPHRDRQAEKAAAEAEKRRKAEDAAREREEERRRTRIDRAQEKVDRLTAEADTLRREAERAEREAAEAQKAVQEATRRATLAEENAERIRRRAERAAADVERAEKDLESASR